MCSGVRRAFFWPPRPRRPRPCHRAPARLHRDDRGLVEDDSARLDVNQGIGGPRSIERSLEKWPRRRFSMKWVSFSRGMGYAVAARIDRRARRGRATCTTFPAAARVLYYFDSSSTPEMMPNRTTPPTLRRQLSISWRRTMFPTALSSTAIAMVEPGVGNLVPRPHCSPRPPEAWHMNTGFFIRALSWRAPCLAERYSEHARPQRRLFHDEVVGAGEGGGVRVGQILTEQHHVPRILGDSHRRGKGRIRGIFESQPRGADADRARRKVGLEPAWVNECPVCGAPNCANEL